MDKPPVEVHHPAFYLGEHVPQTHRRSLTVHAILLEALGEALMLLFGPGLALLGPDKGRSDSVAVGVVQLHKPLHDVCRFMDRRRYVRAFEGMNDGLHVVNPFSGAAGGRSGEGLILLAPHLRGAGLVKRVFVYFIFHQGNGIFVAYFL